MLGTAACRLCGRRFRTRYGRPLHYCARCAARVDRKVARTHRAGCRECGRAFETPSLAVRYCSDPCRKKARARGRTASASASAAAAPRRARKRAAKCLVCGGAFPPDKGKGRPMSYCSPPCRAEGTRARMREYMRRYLSDPDRRALHAARLRASSARRSAVGAADHVRSVRCALCGTGFSTAVPHARYCSDPCRKEAAARYNIAYKRRRRERGGAARSAAAKCRACSKEFAPRHGSGMPRLYCSLACRDEARRASDREAKRRERRSSSSRRRLPAEP